MIWFSFLKKMFNCCLAVNIIFYQAGRKYSAGFQDDTAHHCVNVQSNAIKCDQNWAMELTRL